MAVSGNPLRIVIYGGIGSGKSTVSGFLAALGVEIVVADQLGHEVLASNGAAFNAVAERWPDVVEAGEINRRVLGQVVFADADALAELEAMTHPHIQALIRSRVAAAGERPAAIELPIVRDWVGDEWVWVLVDTPEQERIERVVARGGDRSDAIARIAAQPSAAEYHARADWVLPNTGSLEQLEQAVGELWEKLSPA